jgi:hypothetical protein
MDLSEDEHKVILEMREKHKPIKLQSMKSKQDFYEFDLDHFLLNIEDTFMYKDELFKKNEIDSQIEIISKIARKSFAKAAKKGQQAYLEHGVWKLKNGFVFCQNTQGDKAKYFEI